MLSLPQNDIKSLFVDLFAPAEYIDTDFAQFGDLIHVSVRGTEVEARVICVNEEAGHATVQFRSAFVTRQAEITGEDIKGVVRREDIRRYAHVEVCRYGHTFEATVWSVWGSTVELTSGLIIDLCAIKRVVAAAAAETVTA